MTTLAWLGLGAMGSRIAANLLESGFDLTVWNRDPAKAVPLADRGARIASSPAAATASADIVFAMVRDDAAARAVWLDPQTGGFKAMRPGAIAIESSTLTLGFTRELAAAAAARGFGFLDAPVVGSRLQAEARQLIHLVGGDFVTLSRASPVLKAIGGAIHHAGPAGAGMAVKLSINALFGIQVAALAELFGALERQGVAADKASEILGSTPVASPAAKGAMASMAAGSFAPLFPVELVAKDFDYAAAGAAEVGLETPVSRAAGGVFASAIAHGLGGEHLTAARKLY